MLKRDTFKSQKYWGDDGLAASSYLASLDPDDPRVNYNPLGGTKTKACANCEFFNAHSSSCAIVVGDIVPTGDCDLWLRTRTSDERQAQYAQPVKVVNTIKQALKEIFQPDPETVVQDNLSSGFKVFGENDKYWVAFYTNNAQDRDGQWFAEKAHDEYIDRLNVGELPYPELWYYHEAVKSGRAFWIDRVGHTLIAVGEFYDDPTGIAMRQFHKQVGPTEGVSHGFVYPKSSLIDGVYHRYATFEISPLPAEVAANPYTSFVPIEDFQEMAITQEKQDKLIAVLGKERVDQILAAAETKNKAMEDAKVQFKAATENPLELRMKGLEERFDKLLDAVVTIAVNQAPQVESKAKKGPEGSPMEEKTESDDEAEAEGDKPPKKKKEISTPVAQVPQVDVNEALTKQLGEVAQGMKLMQAAILEMNKNFNNYEPASRSQFTQVPPDNAAVLALEQKMNGQGGDQTSPPGVMPSQTPEALMQTIFGMPTVFGK